MDYASFRTGLTYADVYEMLAYERRNDYLVTGQYRGWPGRRAVLRRWRAIKLAMYEYYCRANGASGSAHEQGAHHDSGGYNVRT